MHSQKYNSGLLGRFIFSLCVFLCVAFTSLGQNSNIQITSLATSGGSWSALTGGVYTFVPTADNANIISTDIQNRLNGSGFTKGSIVILTTNATGTQVGNVNVSQIIYVNNSGATEYSFTITASGDIRVSSLLSLIGVDWSVAGNKGINLNLTAGGNILLLAAINTHGANVTGGISRSSGGTVTLNATGYVNTTSAGIINATGGTGEATTTTSGGAVSITGLAGVTLRGNISTINGYSGTAGYGANGSITINDGNAVVTSGAGTGVNDGQVSGVLTGGNFIKTGAGVFALNMNSYKGSTSVNNGTLQLIATNSIPTTSALSIGATGVLDMAGYSQTLGSLAGLSGGLVTSSITGGLVLTTGDATNTSYAGSIENGIATSIGIVKTGLGILTLSGNSTYSGTTVINGGAINVQHNNGLGVSSLVSVAANAGLQLQNNVRIPALPLSLTGSGSTSNTGALRNISGDNSWAGTLTLATSTVTIGSDAGELSLSASNSINSSTNIPLVFTGSGKVHVLGSITTGSTTLTKNGIGTLTLSGENTYTGTTNISAGVLKLGASNVVSDLSPINMAGGTLHTSGFSENFGALTLSNSSNLILGAGSHQINFANVTTFSTTRILTITGWTGVFTPTSDPQVNTHGKLETTSSKFVSNRGVIKSIGILNQFGKMSVLGPSGTGVNIFMNSTLTAAQLNQIKVINSTDASTHFATQLDSNEIVPNYAQ